MPARVGTSRAAAQARGAMNQRGKMPPMRRLFTAVCLLACVATLAMVALWVRSRDRMDGFSCTTRSRMFLSVMSRPHGLEFWWARDFPVVLPLGLHSHPASVTVPEVMFMVYSNTSWRYCGFRG